MGQKLAKNVSPNASLHRYAGLASCEKKRNSKNLNSFLPLFLFKMRQKIKNIEKSYFD